MLLHMHLPSRLSSFLDIVCAYHEGGLLLHCQYRLIHPFSEAICFWVVKGGSQIVDTQQVFKVIEKGFPKFPFLVMQ